MSQASWGWRQGRRGLSDPFKVKTKKKLENALKIQVDDEAFDRPYGFRSHPIPLEAGKRVALRVVSQFGGACTHVLLQGNGG